VRGVLEGSIFILDLITKGLQIVDLCRLDCSLGLRTFTREDGVITHSLC
jgi:hypothetical protein